MPFLWNTFEVRKNKQTGIRPWRNEQMDAAGDKNEKIPGIVNVSGKRFGLAGELKISKFCFV